MRAFCALMKSVMTGLVPRIRRRHIFCRRASSSKKVRISWSTLADYSASDPLRALGRVTSRDGTQMTCCPLLVFSVSLDPCLPRAVRLAAVHTCTKLHSGFATTGSHHFKSALKYIVIFPGVRGTSTEPSATSAHLYWRMYPPFRELRPESAMWEAHRKHEDAADVATIKNRQEDRVDL